MRVSLIVVFILISSCTIGQSVFDQQVKEYYFVISMDSLMQSMMRKYGFEAEYDRADYANLKMTVDFAYINLAEALNRIAKRMNNSVAFEDKKAIFTKGYKQPSKVGYTGPSERTNITIQGTVVDRASAETIPYASIRVQGSTFVVSTNIDGYFSIFNVPNDTCTIEVVYGGYEKTLFKLSPEIAKEPLLIELVDFKVDLEIVEIVGEREDLMQMNDGAVSMIKMSPKKIQQLPNVGEKDMMRSFQLMPGISAANESSSGLYVRGGTPDQNLITYDGFTVYHVDHLYGFFSAFNSNAIKDIQLYKGGFESKYGGRLSSVTEITGKEGNRNKLSGGGDISLLSVNAYLEGPIGKKSSFIIAGRRSYQGILYDKIFESFQGEEDEQQQGPPGGNQFGTENKVTNYFYDLNGKFTYRPNEKDIFTISFYNGTDKLDNSTDISGPPGLSTGDDFSFSVTDITRYGNVGSALKWSRKWNDKFYGNSLISFSKYYSYRNRTNEGSFTRDGEEETVNFGTIENNDLNDFSFRSDYGYDISNRNKLDFGVQLSSLNIKYNFAQNDTTTVLDKNESGFLSAFYLGDKIDLFDRRLQLNPSVRANYYSETSKFYIEPRFNAVLKLTKKLSLKGATGIFNQFANRITREDILSGSRDFWLLSDGDKIPVSKSTHFITGLSYETSSMLYSVEAYRKNYTGLSEYSLRFSPTTGGVNYDENFYNGHGYSEGMEFLVQRKTGKLNGWVSYTLSESRSQYDIYGEEYFAASQDVTHEFKLVSIYSIKKWDFSATWIFATGRPYTSPSGAYSVTLLDGTTQDFFTASTKNSLRLPNYHRLDLACNYKFRNSEGVERGYIGLSIFNLYNRENVWYKEFSIIDQTVVETDVKYLGVTPNITFSLKF
jgi:ferric enterobactin receptor